MKLDKLQSYSLWGIHSGSLANRTAGTVRYSSASAAPSFTGAGEKVTAELLKDVQGRFMNLFPNATQKAIKFINKFKNLQGEKGGIVITAFGTGFVAPFPIAFNPMVKAKPGATQEEKDEVRKTKQYTALRQPVSAACAIGLQTPILKYIDKVLDLWYNNPKYSKNMSVTLDRSALNNDSYVTNIIKKEMRSKSLDEMLGEEGLARIKDAKGVLESDESVIKRLVRARTDKQIDAVALGLMNEGQINIGSRHVSEETLAKIVNRQIDNYIKEISDLKKGSEGIKFYLQRAKELVDNEATLREILDPQKIAALPRDAKDVAKADPHALKGYLEELLKGDYNNDVKNLLKEIVDKAPGVRESRCSRTLERIGTVKRECGGEFTLDKYYNVMKSKDNKLDSLMKSFEKLKISAEDIANKSVTKEKIIDVIKSIEQKCIVTTKDKKFADLLLDSDVFAQNAQKLGSKVYKDIVKNYRGYAEKYGKLFGQISKIFVGVFITLPITCTALNWIYPRFMDIFFPGLAGTKKATEAKKNGGIK